MDYIKPIEVVKTMLAAGDNKAGLPVKDLLIRGILSGALLGFATSLAITAAAQTGVPLVGALIFPGGLRDDRAARPGTRHRQFRRGDAGRRGWPPQLAARCSPICSGCLSAISIGSLIYGVLLYVVLTSCGSEAPSGIAAKIVAIAEAKTTAYAAHGMAGMVTVVVKGILCNWMVCLGVVMAMTSQSTVGKIVAMWLPILTFFAQGFEHSVVNMFVIPTGMMLGAKVSLTDWWIWNQIPVTIGNLIGGFLFTGLFLYWTYPPAKEKAATATVPEAATEELAQA